MNGVADIAARHLRHLFASFGYSLSGLSLALGETAFKQELALGLVAMPLAFLLRLSLSLKLLLAALWAVLLAAELLNTAIEAVVDLASPGRHPLAKKAKDCASAAVFVIIVMNALAWAAALARALRWI